MTAPRFLTLSDVAEELQVSLSQVRALVRSGELPAIQIGGRNQWRIERSRFEEYITERHEQTLEAIASGPQLALPTIYPALFSARCAQSRH